MDQAEPLARFIPPPPKKGHPIKAKAVTDLMALQRLLIEDAKKSDVTPAVRAQIARAWVDLQDTRLRMQFRPAPKPLAVDKKGKPLDLPGRRRGRATTAQPNIVELDQPTPPQTGLSAGTAGS